MNVICYKGFTVLLILNLTLFKLPIQFLLEYIIIYST